MMRDAKIGGVGRQSDLMPWADPPWAEISQIKDMDKG